MKTRDSFYLTGVYYQISLFGSKGLKTHCGNLAFINFVQRGSDIFCFNNTYKPQPGIQHSERLSNPLIRKIKLYEYW